MFDHMHLIFPIAKLESQYFMAS